MAAIFCLQCDRTSLWLQWGALVASCQRAVQVLRTFVVNRRNFSMYFFCLKLIFIITVFIVCFCFYFKHIAMVCFCIFYFSDIYIISYFFSFCIYVCVQVYSRHFVALVYLCSPLLWFTSIPILLLLLLIADCRCCYCCCYDEAAPNVVSHN